MSSHIQSYHHRNPSVHTVHARVYMRAFVVLCVLSFETEILPCLLASDLWSSNSGNLLLTSRNTDKRSSFHTVPSFILTPHSFPLMYFNVLLSLLLSDHSTSHHPHIQDFSFTFLVLSHSECQVKATECYPETGHCSDLVKRVKNLTLLLLEPSSITR